MKKYYWLILILILIIISVALFPTIFDRIKNLKIVENNRSTDPKPLSYIELNGEAKKVPSFLMTNQNNLLISNEDFNGKVYLV